MPKGPRRAAAVLFVLAASHALQAQAPVPQRPAGAAETGLIKIRIAHVYDENYPWHKAFERFRDIVKARSGGAIEVQIFPNGTLGGEKDYVSLLRLGALDVATVSSAAVSAVAPEVGFFELMYLFKDYDHWRRSLDGKLGHHFADVIRRSTSKAGTPGLEVLGYWSGSALNIVGRSRGYQTMDDLLGMKIRSQGVGVQLEQWKAVGARPVVVPYDGMYAAFKDGVLDATPGVVPSVYAMKFHEVAPHISETNHAFIVRICLMSGQTWNKLSPEQRTIVTDAAKEATTVARTLETQQEEELKELLKTKYGVKFYPFRDKDQLREKTSAVRHQFADEQGLTEMLAALEAEWAHKR
jgi:tripartite ATP-independent transporter DctP family solute receptor